jgi:type IV pilus assembly protein PilA
MNKLSKSNKGFTLVELIVVIAILAVLAVIAVVAFTGLQSGAQSARNHADAVRVADHLNLHESLGGLRGLPADVASADGTSNARRNHLGAAGHTSSSIDTVGGASITITVDGSGFLTYLLPPAAATDIWTAVIPTS